MDRANLNNSCCANHEEKPQDSKFCLTCNTRICLHCANNCHIGHVFYMMEKTLWDANDDGKSSKILTEVAKYTFECHCDSAKKCKMADLPRCSHFEFPGEIYQAYKNTNTDNIGQLCMYCATHCYKDAKFSTQKIGDTVMDVFADDEFECYCGKSGNCERRANIFYRVPANIVPKVAPDNFVAVNNVIGSRIFATLRDSPVFSPVSIMAIMGVIHLATDGNTRQQITAFMGRELSIDDLMSGFHLFDTESCAITNVIVVNPAIPVKPEYTRSVDEIAKIFMEDFSQPDVVVNKINSLVSKETNRLVPKILEPDAITPDTSMVWVNTIYFDAGWKFRFNKDFTTPNVRFNTNRKCTMMTIGKDMKYDYYEDAEMQVVRMLYTDERYCMDVFLHKKNAIINPYNGNFKFGVEKVLIELPKFTHRRKMDMEPVLNILGVTDLFNPKMADLSRIGHGYISKFVHEAVVMVDEERTTATGASVGVAMIESVSSFIRFRADHTFTYRIVHRPTNSTMFIGVYEGDE